MIAVARRSGGVSDPSHHPDQPDSQQRGGGGNVIIIFIIIIIVIPIITVIIKPKVMRANSWLYHYYMVQSRLQYGLAYGAHSPAALSSLYYPHVQVTKISCWLQWPLSMSMKRMAKMV